MPRTTRPYPDNPAAEVILARLGAIGRSVHKAEVEGGLKKDTIRNILRKPSTSPRLKTLDGLAKGLNWTREELLAAIPGFGGGDNAAPAEDKIPVYGVRAGYVPGATEVFDSRNPVGTIGRPTELKGVPGAYAIKPVGTSMTGILNPGEIAFVNPTEPYDADDNVVVIQKVGNAVKGFAKIFVKKRSDRIVCRQVEDEAVTEFMLSSVLGVHKIVSKRFR